MIFVYNDSHVSLNQQNKSQFVQSQSKQKYLTHHKFAVYINIFH